MFDRKRDFTFRQLSSFVAAARTGSFALAAERLGVSQPAISDHISTLERHLGHRLFERRRGTTPVLTREGIDMLQRAETLLRTSHAMRSDDARAAQQGKLRLRISIGPRLRETLLKPLLPRFYADNPRMEVEIVPIMPMRTLLAGMQKGQIDLMLHTVGGLPDGIGSISFSRDVPINLVVAPQLARRIDDGQCRLEDLPFILPDNGVNPEQWFERHLAAAGIVPREPIRYVEFADVVQTMAESGLGATILMREQIGEALAAGRLVMLGPTLPSMRRIMVRSPMAPHDTQRLEACLVEALRTAEQGDAESI